MTPFQAFKKIEKASGRLMLGWVLNNLLGLVSFLTLIYLIWWQWHLSFWGIPALIGGLWLINAYLLPKFFRLLNKPHIESAKSGALVLATRGVIDEAIVQKLADTAVEHWTRVITSSMSAEEFKSKLLID